MFKQYLQTVEIKPIVEEVFNTEKNEGDISGLLEDNERIHEQLDSILDEQGNLRESFDNITQSLSNNIVFEEINIPSQEDGEI